MIVNYKENGTLLSLEQGGMKIDFTDKMGFFVERDDNITEISAIKTQNGFKGELDNLTFSLSFEENENYISAHIKVENNSDTAFDGNIGLHTGVYSYMENYPQWHTAWFPTMLRCEKSHIWGYFMNTKKNALAFATDSAVASFNIDYNRLSTGDYGHRILGTDIIFFQNTRLPERHPQNLKQLQGGSVYENTLYFIPVEKPCQIMPQIHSVAGVPMVYAENYTLEKGNKIDLAFLGDIKTKTLVLPDGSETEYVGQTADAYGLYTLKATDNSGKQCEAKLYCRKEWDFYLTNAALQALAKPQKATTHIESHYGLFSLFLAAKRNNDSELLEKAENILNEIMPYMYSVDPFEPTVIIPRIQNTALFIGVLADAFEASKNEKYLYFATGLADWLIDNCQDEKGIYRREHIHYTCVIYIAKAILELALCVKECGIAEYEAKYDKLYGSVKRAIDELAASLDDIETEGESTLEDGMISCSGLQIAMFALTLPENERKYYIDAAEKMMEIHSCLEQKLIPDCRMNGASLRYWESQYDVVVLKNMLNSPHGWTGWTAYAHYYLYMLTGKKQYLLSLMNTLGTCAQLINLEGELRWGFCAQPYVKAQTLVPDLEKEVKDGYEFVYTNSKAYRGKSVEKEYGEEYIPMISGWYRIGEQKVTGGYTWCPLFLKDRIEKVDNQGGCCDNDVHEIFKCIAETVLGKAFIFENEDGSFLAYGCTVEKNGSSLEINADSGVNMLCYNLKGEFKTNLSGEALSGFGTINI